MMTQTTTLAGNGQSPIRGPLGHDRMVATMSMPAHGGRQAPYSGGYQQYNGPLGAAPYGASPTYNSTDSPPNHPQHWSASTRQQDQFYQ
jgi:hypothetical protein